jgi:hypothetical protein
MDIIRMVNNTEEIGIKNQVKMLLILCTEYRETSGKTETNRRTKSPIS